MISTITSTTPVQVRPTALTVCERRIRRRLAGSVSLASNRFQCRIMPAWLTVNDTNTPTMYSWISRVTSASNAMISTSANAARNRMPLENASRSPRVCSCRGR